MKQNWTFPKRWTTLLRETFRQRNGTHRVPLTVGEPSGVSRKAHPVTSGVPIPEGALAKPSACRLLDERKKEIPLQTQALARWPNGSVKWLLLDFQLDLKPNTKRKLTLEFGRGISSRAKHPSPVSIARTSDGVEINTGNLKSTISNHQLPFSLRSVFTARSTEGDRNGQYVAKVDDIQVEESGPLRAVVRVSGWHVREHSTHDTQHSAPRRSMQFIMRFTAWAGLPVLGVQHTFVITDDPMTTFWRGIGLQMPVTQGSRYQETKDGIAIAQSGDHSLGAMVRLRDKYLPKENVFDPATHTLGVYLWPLHGDEMDLRPVMVRRPKDFVEWTEKYPDAFHHIEGGALSQKEAEDAFSMKVPCPSMGDMRARTGMGVAKTHDIFLANGTNSAEIETALRPFNKPLFAFATPQYYSQTKAFGSFHPYDPKNFPDIERSMDAHFCWIQRHIHEWSNWTGIFDYGDVLSVYDSKRGEWWKYDGGRWGWLNGEVNSEQGIFLQYLRTGKREWLDFAEATARHRIDCDQTHYHDKFPELVGGMHRHYMLEHWSGQIDCGHIWVDGAINLYYFFGHRRGLECAIEGAEMAARFSIPNVLHHGDTSRETNNALRCLARVYEATGDTRYREMADVFARGYLCPFDEHGWPITLAETEKKLEKQFAGTNWWKLPEIINYNWHGHCGYQYIGYFAPAVRYWATIGRTKAALDLQKMFDCYSPALDLGNEGQFFGEMYLETNDPRYLTHIVRGLPGTIQFPIPSDGKGDKPGSYSNPRLDYLHGIPYVLAAFYAARNKMDELLPKSSAYVPGYRSTDVVAPVHGRARSTKRSPGTATTTSFACLNLTSAANHDPRENPFVRPLEDEYANKLPDLKPGQIGFQPHNGSHKVKRGYIPVAPHHVYPSSEATVTPNRCAVPGLPLGGRVVYAGIPFHCVNPEANHGKSIIVLGANQSATIPVEQKGRALYLLGHVHGKKHARQISQFAPKVIGHYEIRYADGSVTKMELINGVHFDSFFNHAYASGVTHVANFDWMHVFANITDDRMHLNVMRLPLKPKPVKSITLRSTNENWGLLLMAATLETSDVIPHLTSPPRGEAKSISAKRSSSDRISSPLEGEDKGEGWFVASPTWQDLPGWPEITVRRQADKKGIRMMAPCRANVSARDGFYEVELTVSGDPHPYAAPRIRVECGDAQVLADYCLPGAGKSERIRFHAKAKGGTLSLDLHPAPNHATGKLPQLGLGKGSYSVGGSYGNWRAPEGNFTRIESIRIRPVPASEVAWPKPKGRQYGFLLPGATGEAARGGLIVDHEDSNDFTPSSMKWKAGGFRADVPNGRYKVTMHHTTYADLGNIFVDLTINGKPTWSGEVNYETIEIEGEATDGHLTIEWCQPHSNIRCPRYAIRGIVLEPIVL